MKKYIITLILLLTLFSRITLSQNFVELVNTVDKAVFLIETFDKNMKPIATGSGFFVDENGTGVSNVHVFEDAFSAKIKTYDNKYFSINKVIAANEENDVIKFSINNFGSKFKFLVPDFEMPLKGQEVFVVGSPEGLESSVSKGIIASARTVEGYGNTIQFTAAISHGNSGSPLLNMKGKIIGIVTFTLTSGQNLNFAININVLKGFAANPAKYQINKPISEVNMLNKSKKYLSAGLQAREDGRMEDALNFFTKFININPNELIGYSQRAYTKQKMNDYKGAIADWDMTISINPDYYFAISNKAAMLFNLHEYSNAIKYYNKTIENLKGDETDYYSRGQCKERLEDYNGAVEDYSLAINFNKQFVEALIDRAKVYYFHFGLKDEANRDLTRAIAINPEYSRAYTWRGYVNVLDDPNSACQDFRKSLSLEYSKNVAETINMSCK